VVQRTETAETLLARLRGYCLPGGEEAARGVRGIRATQRGEIRSSAEAKWLPFTAEEYVDATRSAFCWTARMGSGVLTSVAVTDAYEEGHGRLVVKKGPVTLRKLAGAEVDKGELQRYLGYASYCPPMLVNHGSLDWTLAGPRTLGLRDRLDQSGASVDVEIDENGRPVVTRAVRPMTVGKRVIPTPWSATGTDEDVREGLRICTRLAAAWHPADGNSFTYIRIELTSFAVERR
jgi:hypothetical protein